MVDARDVFDRMTLGMIQTLERRLHVWDVRWLETEAATMADLTKWEMANCYTLPAELKNFYLSFNGLTIVWTTAAAGDCCVPLGRLHIAPLSELKPIKDDNKLPKQLLSVLPQSHTLPENVTPFSLDCCQGDMTVAVLLGSGAAASQVWLKDMADGWHYLASSFIEYYRLMTLHLGLPHWQLGLTSLGLPPHVEHMYHMYIPLRTDLAQTSKEQSVPRRRVTSERQRVRSRSEAVSVDLSTVHALFQERTAAVAADTTAGEGRTVAATPPVSSKPRASRLNQARPQLKRA